MLEEGEKLEDARVRRVVEGGRVWLKMKVKERGRRTRMGNGKRGRSQERLGEQKSRDDLRNGGKE